MINIDAEVKGKPSLKTDSIVKYITGITNLASYKVIAIQGHRKEIISNKKCKAIKLARYVISHLNSTSGV